MNTSLTPPLNLPSSPPYISRRKMQLFCIYSYHEVMCPTIGSSHWKRLCRGGLREVRGRCKGGVEVTSTKSIVALMRFLLSYYSNLVYTNNPFSNNEFNELNELLRVVIRLIRLIRCFYKTIVSIYLKLPVSPQELPTAWMLRRSPSYLARLTAEPRKRRR